MRWIVACISHETNSFSPVTTGLQNFGIGAGPFYGRDAYEGFRRARIPMGAFLDAAEARGIEVVTPIVARCSPSGPVEDDAFEAIVTPIVEAARAGADALFLDLHGAMITRTYDDGDGELLRRVRAAAPDMPICLALDLHANISRAMMDAVDVAVGYRTFPHIDMYETGERAAAIMIDRMEGRAATRIVWGAVPVLPLGIRTNTSEEPLRTLVAMAAEAEKEEGIRAVSVFSGFWLGDSPDTALSVVVMADDERNGAAVRDRILRAGWEGRAGFDFRSEPLEKSVAEAKALMAGPGTGPVVLVDHADNCNSGGVCDSMTVIAEALRQGLTGGAAAPLCDPESAAALVAAGVGATVTLDLGEKLPSPALAGGGRPLRLTGRVAAVSEGQFTVEGPVYTGTRINLGPTAAFDIGPMTIVVTSRRTEPYDHGVFKVAGIDPTTKRFLVVKSKTQFRPTYAPIARGIVYCAGVGVATSDLSLFRFERLRRPIWPLDPDARYPAA
ncbi:MAG: M81 family metallopeptidase [Alphaproteobacteria bacterium]